jgi:hypothetical protein
MVAESGHDVIYMPDVAPRATDAEVIGGANRENRLLLTEDKDFGDLVFRRARPVPGIVLLHIDSADIPLEAARSGEAVHSGTDAWGSHWRVDVTVRRHGRALW